MNGSDLRGGLLGAEAASAELEKKYREAILGLVERRLTPAQRGVHLFGVAMGLALVAFFVNALLGLPPHPRPTMIAGIAVGLAFSAGWALLSFASMRGGRENLRVHAMIRTQLVFGFTALLMALMTWVGMTSADVLAGIRVMLYGIVFFVGIGIPYFVAQAIRSSELRVREDVLRLRLELARAVGRQAR